MTPTVAHILNVMEEMAPINLAESWDNPGLQVGSTDWPVTKIVVSLDPTLAVIENAVKESADLLISHHPLIFNPIKKIDLGTPLGKSIDIAIRNRLAVYSAHTNFDSARNGLNDILVSRIGLTEVSVLAPHEGDQASSTNETSGLGRIGSLPRQTDLATLCRTIKKNLQLQSVRMIGPSGFPVNRVALCTGSGSGLMDRFFDTDADVFITGDIRYHDARNAEERGRALMDIGHFNSEHIMIEDLCGRLEGLLDEAGSDITVHACNVEGDPFVVI